MPSDIPDIFDRWAAAASITERLDADETQERPNAPVEEPSSATPAALRRVLQELLKYGWLEQLTKPHLYRQIATQTSLVDSLLEPLDLCVKVDDHRGLAFVAIAATYQPDGEDEDEWTHPLVRRQRLTLEQSLLLAILRREFLQREQESGLGAPVQMLVDNLKPQLEIYLGSTGSDIQERKRLMNLLEHLRGHGVVSEVDAQDRFTIRPMIVHLANPENLQTLLQRLREIGGQTDGNTATPETET